MQNDKLLKFKEKFAGMNPVQKVFAVIAIILAIAAGCIVGVVVYKRRKK